MKTISAELQTHKNGALTTMATCVLIERKDSTLFAFTSHDRALLFDGTSYEPALSLSRTAIRGGTDMQVDSSEAEGVLDSGKITIADLRAGLFDHAAVDIFDVNWADLTQGPEHWRSGWLGQIKLGQSRYQAEVRGLTQALQTRIVQLSSPSCRVDLGSTKCGVDLASLAQIGTVSGVTNNRRFAATGLTGGAVRNISYTNSTISFVAPGTIKDSANGFVAAGFVVGDQISIGGSGSNDRLHAILTLAAGTITVAGDVVTEAAGASITLETENPDYFAFGLVTWTGGLNDGLTKEVKSWAASGSLVLLLPMPFAVQAGDTFSITPGCNKRMPTCSGKYGNIISFRGEFVTGQDAAFAYPDAN